MVLNNITLDNTHEDEKLKKDYEKLYIKYKNKYDKNKLNYILIGKLYQKGYELAVMSNSTNQMMDWHMEKLEYLFDGRLVAEETMCYKPKLSFFQMAEEKFHLKGKNHCHIAKGYWWDIVPAYKMGWNKIWVNRANLSHGRDIEKPYLTVSTLLELPQI